MKTELLQLIEKTEEIEKCFHRTPGFFPSSRKTASIDSALRIHDVPQFVEWIESLKYELRLLQTKSPNLFIEDVLTALNADFDGWHDERYFREIKAKLIVLKNKIDDFYTEGNEEMQQIKQPKIFISHSSKDVQYVDEIVDILKCMNVTDNCIFCSSVAGYGIPVGENIFDYLKKQFDEFNLHVLLIHSHNYYNSAVSLNEMGAAWVLKKLHTSILLPGFNYGDMSGIMGASEIAIKLDDSDFAGLKDKLNQLKEQIAGEFNVEAPNGTIWERTRDRFVDKIVSIAESRKSEQETSEEPDLLLHDDGFYFKRSEISAGRKLRYCAACYQNHKKLFPITQGALKRDYFCTKCRMRYSGWTPPTI